MQLSEKEKNTIIDYIKNDEPLPKEYIYKLFSDDEDVFLFWNGRDENMINVSLPFHSIEHIDEPRKEPKKESRLQLLDTKGRQLEGWTNKLIWGDNRLILSSLVNGPMREAIEKEGGLKLIYIDPPFAVGADFSYEININGEKATKKQSILEEIAYRDTWGRGISSYLSMMYERLKLMYSLLANDGSIYVHCDYRTTPYTRLVLDDIFGRDFLQNEIIWCYNVGGKGSKRWARKHDTIWFYSKSDDFIFDGKAAGVKRYTGDKSFGGIIKQDENGRYYQDKFVKSSQTYYRYYLDEPKIPEDWWSDINSIQSGSRERINYPTQKPEALLDRIIKASSNEGDLVADFFCGCGTTTAVAEKLGRKWIACDLNRFAIHTTRKRMIDMQRHQKSNNNNFRAFEVLNLGKYERQFFINDLRDNGELKQKEDAYIDLILEAYHAQRIENHRNIHGRKSSRMVHVGPLDVPITKSRIDDIFKECKDNLYTQVDVLGFEFEMGLVPYIKQELKEQGININLKYIPNDVFDKRAVESGQIKFYDVSYLNAEVIKIDSSRIQVKLKDFVSSYSQDDITEKEKSLKRGSSKVVIEDGQVTKITKDKKDFIHRELLTKKWTDWIDYWSVDFNLEDKKEIIQMNNEDSGEVEEYWTGNYIFENEWQSFRTREQPKLELVSAPYTYNQPGRYKIMVKVVDILGIDTSQILEVNI